MQAAILAVGSELLGTDRLDTNSLRITESLHRFGVQVRRKCVVGDDVEELATEIGSAHGRYPLLIITGGIGPTSDDLTREAVALALDRELVHQEWIVDDIRAKFARFGREMPDSNRKQADVIEGAEVLANRRGTAPGQRIDHAGGTIFVLPGVPHEVEGLIEHALEPWLESAVGAEAVEVRWMKVACVPESTLEQLIAPYFEEFAADGLSILSKPGEILLQLSGPSGSAEELALRERRLVELLGDAVYGHGRDDTLERTVGELLRDAAATVVTAESCTGGLVAERLTRSPGSSDYFLGAAITYSNELKSDLLGVDPRLIEKHGAVSREVVEAMALGGRTALGGDYCIAISGVAGPGGGTAEKPLGTVDLAVAGPDRKVRYLRVQLPGDRDRIRQQASQWGLDMLRRWLSGAQDPSAAHLAPRAVEVSRVGQ